MELCWNESQATESIKEAKAVCSWVTLNAKTTCSVVVKEAKTTQACIVQEANSYLLYSHQRCWSPRGPLRLSHSKGNMAMSCGTWRNKSSERRAEVKLTSSLPARLPCMHQPTRAQKHSGCFLPHFIGANTSITSICPVTEGLPCGRTTCFSHVPPTPAPKQSPRPKKMAAFTRSCGEYASGQNHFEGDSGRTPLAPSGARDPTLGQSTQAEPHWEHLAKTLTW